MDKDHAVEADVVYKSLGWIRLPAQERSRQGLGRRTPFKADDARRDGNAPRPYIQGLG